MTNNTHEKIKDMPYILIMGVIILILIILYPSYKKDMSIKNFKYAISIDSSKWYKLNDSENIYTTYDSSFNYDIYALRDSEVPFEFVAEYGQKSNVDLYEMVTSQMDMLGVDIISELTGGEQKSSANYYEYTYADDEYTVYCRIERDFYDNILFVGLISPYTKLYNSYGKEVIDSIKIDLSNKTINNTDEIETVELSEYTSGILNKTKKINNIEAQTEGTEDIKSIKEVKIITEGLNEITTDFFNQSNEFDTISLPILSQSNNKLYAYTPVIIPNNVIDYDQALDYIFIGTEDEIFTFIDTYDYSGVYKNGQDYLEVYLESYKDESETYNGNTIDILYQDNNSLFGLYELNEYTNYIVCKFNEDVFISYYISCRANNNDAKIHILNMVEQMNIKYSVG